jgi:GT2 family glycosyltransferase
LVISENPASAGRAAASPLVSILIPAHNAAQFVRETLDSVLAQTYKNLQIILLDDASSDSTAEIATEYADQVSYVRQQRNLGIYDNANVGIQLARGDLIAIYHADDIYLPTIVEAEVAYFEAHPEVGAVFCAHILADAKGREYGRMELPAEVRGGKLLDYRLVLNTMLAYKNRFLVCPSAMVRASVYRDVGLYCQERYRNTADLEMWLRIARHYPIAILESHLLKYRHFHGSSAQRYHYLRTSPENFFTIIDERLAMGDRKLATRASLISYEAHRSEDRLMAAISWYIKGELTKGRCALHEVQIGKIVRAPQVQRWRLLVIAAGLWVLLRLPRMEPVSRLMYRRWHVKRPPRARCKANKAAAFIPN